VNNEHKRALRNVRTYEQVALAARVLTPKYIEAAPKRRSLDLETWVRDQIHSMKRGASYRWGFQGPPSALAGKLWRAYGTKSTMTIEEFITVLMLSDTSEGNS
jgi:hypothetical protein